MANASNALIGWPIYSDVGVRLTPTPDGGSWLAGLPLTNLQRNELYLVARSTDATAQSTRFRYDLGEDKQVRCIGVPKHSGTPTAKFRFLGVPSSVQGVLFDYEAGDDVVALGGTFARATTATYTDRAGVVRTANSGVIRDNHWVSGRRRTLLEPARTNRCLQASNFGTTWAATGTPTRVAGAHTASGVTLDLIGDDDGAALEGYAQTITFSGTGDEAPSLYVKQGSSASSCFRLRDTTAGAQRLEGFITWSGGVPVVTMTAGTYLGKETLADGVYRLLFYCPLTVANTNQLQVWPATTAGLTTAQTGTIYAGGVQVEDGKVPTSLIPTTTVTVTRNADNLSFPCAAVPQVATMYADFDEIAFGLMLNGTAFVVGTNSTTGPYWGVQGDGSGNYVGIYKPASTVRSSGATVTAAYGDRVELLSTLTALGVEQLAASKNGGATVTGAAATADTLPGAWQAATLLVAPASAWGNAALALGSLRIMAGVQTLSTMQGVVYDSGWFTPFPAGKTLDDVEGMNLGAWQFPASTLTPMRYVSCQIDDIGNTAGFVDVNRFVVTGGFQPDINFSVGGRVGLETATVNTDSDVGVTSSLRKPTRRNVTCAFQEQTESQAFGNQFPHQRVAGTDRQFVFSWDPTDTTYLHHRTFLATLKQLSEFEVLVGNRFGIPYAAREVL